MFVFTGQRTEPKKSYILLFDLSTQQATLEPLASTYTFNLSSKNGSDLSSTYPKIYPKKQKDDAQDTAAGADDLFDEDSRDDINDDPDPDNPYDFRHFLAREGSKRGDESEYNTISSPDYRTGTGSAMNTPMVTARKPAPTPASKAKVVAQGAANRKKRASPEPATKPQKKTAPKKQQQPPPTVRLERRATTAPKPEPAKPSRKPAAPPASKIKSAEIVHSSDDSDLDADGEPDSPAPPTPPPPRKSPSPQPVPDADSDYEMEDVSAAAGLEIEVPDARPSRPRHNALASLGLGQNLGLGGYLKSPSNGPISLASAANSVEGSPNPHAFTPRKNRAVLEDSGVIDFGDIGSGAKSDDEEEEEEEGEDGDVEPMDIGPPAQPQGHDAGADALMGMDEEEDAEGEEEDPLYKQMMEGLAGESSEESEEE